MCVFVLFSIYVFFFKQKTAYEMRISDWSSDVCSSDLAQHRLLLELAALAGFDIELVGRLRRGHRGVAVAQPRRVVLGVGVQAHRVGVFVGLDELLGVLMRVPRNTPHIHVRTFQFFLEQTDSLQAASSEEHTSELQSQMRISYAVSC